MVNIHSIKQKIVTAKRFIKSEMEKEHPNHLKIGRTRNGILNLQGKLRNMREKDGKNKKSK